MLIPSEIAFRMRELRRMRGLSQKELARDSGIGEKSISSFETSMRAHAIKITQLQAILAVYRMTEEEFFGEFGKTIERTAGPLPDDPVDELTTELLVLWRANKRKAERVLKQIRALMNIPD